MRRQLKPLFDRVVIKELDPDRVRRSGLVVPAGDHELPPQHGIVLAVGPGIDWWESAGVAMPVKVGDHVVFPANAGVWIEVDEERLLVCRVGELLGVIEQAAGLGVLPHVSEGITLEELQLAARNHGMPLEALRHEITPLGLHYLLVHYDIPVIDAAAWRLTIGGRVDRALELSLDDLRARERVTQPVTMECAGNGRARLEPRPISQPWLAEAVGTAEWTGVPLAALAAEAGLAADALDVVFTGLDRGVEGGVVQLYERSLSIADAARDDVLLAYDCNGEPLPPQHGFPLRLVVPGWYGMTSVKWLQQITVLAESFEGYQMVTGYRMRAHEDDEGTPVTRIEPRSLMVPPGIPDFLTRRRFMAPGPERLEGRAWSGWGPIERVEVSTDGGASWQGAQLGEPPGPAAWAPWWFDWDAPEGEHELCVRARDTTGRSQPDEPPWNVGGYANNAVQRVPVTVTA